MKKLHLFLILALPLFGFGQIISPFIQSAKIISTGNTACSYHDIYDSFSNQAGLARMEGLEIFVGSNMKFQTWDLMGYQFAIAKPYSKLGTFGLNMTMSGFDQYRDGKLGLCYARRLFHVLDVGVQFDILNLNILDYGSAWVYTVELGIVSRISKEVEMSIHVYSPYGINVIEGYDIPTIFKIGAKYNVTSNVDIVAEIQKRPDFIRFNAGVLYRIIPEFTMSLGVFNNSASTNFCGGFGYRIYRGITINGGISLHQVLGLSSAVGLQYDFKE